MSLNKNANFAIVQMKIRIKMKYHSVIENQMVAAISVDFSMDFLNHWFVDLPGNIQGIYPEKSVNKQKI